MTPAPSSDTPHCRDCRHYLVTYEASMPHGCRLFGLRSRIMPCILVEQESGAPCHGHERRPRTPGEDRR